MDEAIRKADVLIEALSYIRRFRDKLTVIKLGGSAMEDADGLRATLQDVVFMETVGLRPILVHGGGRAIDRAMAEDGLKPRKVHGRRYTDDHTLEIVVHVLEDKSADVVAQIRSLGGRAVGLTSSSLQCLFGERLLLPDETGQPLDLGRRLIDEDPHRPHAVVAGGVQQHRAPAAAHVEQAHPGLQPELARHEIELRPLSLL